jgi:DNA-binding transcriptional ArsR family regulator
MLTPVVAPLYQLKAEFFKTLGHPARIRGLELLSERGHTVGEMLPEVGVEAANLSQLLAVLRRAGGTAGGLARQLGRLQRCSLAFPFVTHSCWSVVC